MQTPINIVGQTDTPLPYHLMAEVSSGGAGQDKTGLEGDGLSPKSGVQRVLIADDSMTERANLARIIQDAGYEVITAGSGNEAIALAVEYEPVAIFLDIIMDDGDGYKACRSIKRNAATATIPVIMVSSKSNAVDQKWAEKLGASSYVVKPYADEDIVQKLKQI
ncbi:MAG: response regulator [Thiolinea sp.]